jgi:hypothetical protein
MKHLTADVLAKASIPVPVNINASVVLEIGANRTTVDSRIRADLSAFMRQFRTDNPLRQSDVTAIIEEVVGVSYVNQPLTLLCRAPGSYVVNDVIPSALAGDSFLVTAWSTPSRLTWILRTELSTATTTGGGPEEEFRAVYQNNVILPIQRILPDQLTVNSSYIVGAGGMVIPGYSDDTTLISQGYSSPTLIQQRRVEITRNRVLICIPPGVSPSNNEYQATYLVGNETGPKNINPGPTEFLTLGTVEFVYDEDRENSLRRVRA